MKKPPAAYLTALRGLAVKYANLVDAHGVPGDPGQPAVVVYMFTDVVEAFEAGWFNAIANQEEQATSAEPPAPEAPE